MSRNILRNGDTEGERDRSLLKSLWLMAKLELNAGDSAQGQGPLHLGRGALAFTALTCV